MSWLCRYKTRWGNSQLGTHRPMENFREEVLEWWTTLDFPGITVKSRKCLGYFSWTLKSRVVMLP